MAAVKKIRKKKQVVAEVCCYTDEIQTDRCIRVGQLILRFSKRQCQ